MAHVHLKPGWTLPERAVTPERIYFNRRQILRAMGIAAGAAAAGPLGLFGDTARAEYAGSLTELLNGLPPMDVPRAEAFQAVSGRDITPQPTASSYNNFYEFSTSKDVWRKAQALTVDPWSVQVDGLVHKPKTFSVEELLRRMPLEERVYRLRCVEAWSMVVPWTGFPLSALLKEVEPMSSAKYVRFTTFMRPSEAPRQKDSGFFGPNEPFPYTEGLTVPEAMNELTLLVVGIYGHVLPKQHGAPIRLIVPWKYGFKNAKSIVRIELTEEQPDTFWHTVVPREYGFVSNVNPNVPHPRWSQATERDIGTDERIRTQLFNGYGDYVAGLYPDEPRS